MSAGSSPHTRGAPFPGFRERQAGRIIPAYAGSTPDRHQPEHWQRDHPRIRGEHGPMSSLVGQRLGSSPHTRGALAGGVKAVAESGIIPAYAGSTSGPAWPTWRSRDHPRIRGEHRRRRVRHAEHAGSSPHTRGALVDEKDLDGIDGIIPAYAGSTIPISCAMSFRRDHPRIRGEHRARHLSSPNVRGSSPHTRGAPDCPTPVWTSTGIIPAYAGSTSVS